MNAQTTRKTAKASRKPPKDDLSKYGISRVSVDYFYYGDYKYSDLKDAVAQAKRDLKTAAT